MSQTSLTLITGGSRSGKSRFAIEKAWAYRRKIFLATAVPLDDEMKLRIERHKQERGIDFITVEEPVSLARGIRHHAGAADVILVDCLTFWLNNLWHYFGSDSPGLPEKIQKEIQDFVSLLEEKLCPLILVTNEINMGVIPSDPLTRCFVEMQGRLNQEVARRANEVILMVSGIPQVLKQEVKKYDGFVASPNSRHSAA